MFTNWKKKYEEEAQNHLNTRARLFFLENYFGNKFVKNDRLIIRQSELEPEMWCISSINFGGEGDGVSKYKVLNKKSPEGIFIGACFDLLVKTPVEYFESEPE